MVKQAYTDGAKAAASTFGVPPQTLAKGLELGGLGLVAVPAIHGLVADEDKASPQTKKLLHAADLAGLGMLAAPHLFTH
jgi:hypothetical protein